MLNYVVLVGRLVQDPETKELENGSKNIYITLAIPRNYKNSEGIYETDFITCEVSYSMYDNIKEYCKKGDLVGVKGRMQTREEQEKYIIEIVAEKVTFLSSRKEAEED